MGIFDHLWGGPAVNAPVARTGVRTTTPNANTTPEAVGGKQAVALPPSALPGTWRAVWAAKRLPDPGSGNYAYTTLQLPLRDTFVTGPGPNNVASTVRPSPVFRLFRGTEMPLFANQQVVVTGIPLTAGQIDLNPLFDPNAPGDGYTAQTPLLEGFD